MYSNMCVKFVLCSALIATIDGFVLKHQTVEPPLPLEHSSAVITENYDVKRNEVFTVKSENEEHNFENKNPVVELTSTSGVHEVLPKESNIGPILEDRAGIEIFDKDNKCAEGFILINKYCVPKGRSDERVPEVLLEVTKIVPIKEDREGIYLRKCAIGYIRVNKYCVRKRKPDDNED